MYHLAWGVKCYKLLVYHLAWGVKLQTVSVSPGVGGEVTNC